MKFDYFQYSRDYDIMEVARLFVHYEFFFFRLKKFMISLVLAWGQRLERGRGEGHKMNIGEGGIMDQGASWNKVKKFFS